MRKLIILMIAMQSFKSGCCQLPCSSKEYRQFDFWIGEWDVFAKNGKKAGDSRITLILDSCVILEEWVSSNLVQGLRYAGKSFNTFNAATKNWQQTWVDNVGGSTEYLEGKFESNQMVFQSRPFAINKDTVAVRRLTFINLTSDRIRQHGEISKDEGTSWTTEYDLEYRRKNK